MKTNTDISSIGQPTRLVRERQPASFGRERQLSSFGSIVVSLCLSVVLGAAQLGASEPGLVAAGQPGVEQQETAPAVSLFQYNPPAVQQELQRPGSCRVLYRGILDTDDHAVERMGFRILLRDPATVLASYRLRMAFSRSQQHTRESLEREKTKLAEWLQEAMARDDFSQQYLAFNGPGGRVDPDFMVYTSPHQWLAKLYGNIIFEIREREPRGVCLDEHNLHEYGSAVYKSLLHRLNPKRMFIRNVMDRDEYLIPSHVPNEDIHAFEVRERVSLSVETSSGAGNLAMGILRSYRTSFYGKSHCVDCFDSQDRHIARFSRNPKADLTDETWPASPEAIPRHIKAEILSLRAQGMTVYVTRMPRRPW